MTNQNKFTGFGPDFKTPVDLLLKLEFDYQRIEKNPRDSYAAFDFFVTADNMCDWICDKSLRNKEPLLKIVFHLATGAKHFAPREFHNSVSEIGSEDGAFDANAFDSSAFDVSSLVILLNEDEANIFGTEITVNEFAKLVIGYWRKKVSIITLS
jgi:hypothetical protein